VLAAARYLKFGMYVIPYTHAHTWCPLCCLLFVETNPFEACDWDEQQAVSEALAIHHALGRSVRTGEDASEIDGGNVTGDTDEELNVLNLVL
jgi:hypothetical protein